MQLTKIREVEPSSDGLLGLRLSTDTRRLPVPYTAPMGDPRRRALIEPLFAHNARLWLRVWIATQLVILGVATYAAAARSAGTSPASAPLDVRFVFLLAILLGYHAVGFFAYAWIMRRTWAVLVYVPLFWVILLSGADTNAALGLLAMGAILQGFIFLPFAWAISTLAAVTAVFSGSLAARNRHETAALLLTRVGAVIASGVMIGTVLFYIHHSNRETALRTRLLQQLDDAQRDLADRARDAGALEERQRLSRDIHDTLAQAFSSVIRHLEAVELTLGASARGVRDEHALPAVMSHLRHAQSVSRASLAEIRHVLWALRPKELADAPLSAALGRIVRQWGENNDTHTDFSADVLPALHFDGDVIFLRATQESLSNVARHANATHVAVTLSTVDGLALLTVEDDGRGFDAGDARGAEKFGLSGMRERVRKFGGHVLIESTVGTGTSLTVALPLSAVAAQAPNAGDGA